LLKILAVQYWLLIKKCILYSLKNVKVFRVIFLSLIKDFETPFDNVYLVTAFSSQYVSKFENLKILHIISKVLRKVIYFPQINLSGFSSSLQHYKQTIWKKLRDKFYKR